MVRNLDVPDPSLGRECACWTTPLRKFRKICLTSLAYLQIDARMHRHKKTEKIAAPPLAPKRLPDPARDRDRYLHYSLKTEKDCLYWVRFFVLWTAKTACVSPKK
jgi:hypothetical protein